jgi:hypothetical protein
VFFGKQSGGSNTPNTLKFRKGDSDDESAKSDVFSVYGKSKASLG